ncbi:hypothetical protein SH528x_000934 [Novipirellula sp. SH528]|uniref:hypothetical protein n=1 Tax=Novipirellula sp. SH528 TaxID=3454466 RepID=UPI003FA099CA
MKEEDWNRLEGRPHPKCVSFCGRDLRVGDRVRVWPKKEGDGADIILSGKIAIIEEIEQDFEDKVHLALVMDDDPGRDSGMSRQPGHRFFYHLEEVEPLDPN